MAPEPSARKSLQLQHLLYAIASLPFVLFAILWALGAFKGTAPDSRPVPSPSSTASPTPAPNTKDVSNTTRLDTAHHHPPGRNAADFYKQAWSLYKQLDLTDEEKQMLHKRSSKWDKTKAAELFEKIQPIVEMLRQAKNAAYADWGIEFKKFSDRQPQFTATLGLSELLAWNAAYEFQDNPALAVSDLGINLQMGNSVGNAAMIGLLVNGAALGTAIDVLRGNAASLSPDLARQTIALIQISDLQKNLQAALQVESELQSDFILSIKNKPDNLDLFFESLGINGPTADPQENLRLRDFYKNNPTKITDELEWAENISREFAQKAMLPETTFDAWWQSTRQTSSSMPLTHPAMQVLGGVRERMADLALQSSLFRAGLAILQNGDSVLTNYRDPITSQLFQLVPNADGSELQSTFQYQGKPVTMQFSTPKP
ncbi:MAG: hypothetical protein QM796_04340 [Chthoniobacteraceae bacterium]